MQLCKIPACEIGPCTLWLGASGGRFAAGLAARAGKDCCGRRRAHGPAGMSGRKPFRKVGWVRQALCSNATRAAMFC